MDFKVGDRVRYDDSKIGYSSGVDIFEGTVLSVTRSTVEVTRDLVFKESEFYRGRVQLTITTYVKLLTKIGEVAVALVPQTVEGFNAEAHREFMKGL